mmetsp:Transcript_30841/g.70759  ORF Transcript_30841/g.70759 Transcript_30841/m.70759 type:complete len:163 (-) Transcript_30841:4-492(-)
MAVLSDHGQHCAVPHCRHVDFLPFVCDLCGITVCKDHLRYEDHDCPYKGAKDKRIEICPLCNEHVPRQPGDSADLTISRHCDAGECKVLQGSGEARPEVALARCPVAGCKAKLTSSGSVQCSSCQKRFCLKHRYAELHQCESLDTEGELTRWWKRSWSSLWS